MIKTVVVIGMLLTLLGVGVVIWQWHVPRIGLGDAPPVTVIIPPGATVKEIGKILKDKNLIRSRFWFETFVWWKDAESSFLAGEYSVQPDSVAWLVMKKLTVFGRAESADVRVTIIEGWDIGEIAEALKPVNVSSDDFFKIAGTPPRLRRDKSYQNTLEGYLFPDTYFFRKGSSAEEVIRRLRDNFKRRVGDTNNLHETITIASLLQAEVRSEEDMRKVADIIRRRLGAGMGLQIDATVNYVTGNKTPSASSGDLKIDSPYNTYKYRGLPPGPIGAPGLQAIRAAENPLPNPYWFYLTGADGMVHYARTLDEHRANRKFL